MPEPSVRAGLPWMLASQLSFALMALCVSAAHAVDPTAHTFAISAVRALVNLAILVLMVRGDVRSLVGDARPALWLRGVLGSTALLTYFGALGALGAGEASFLNQTSTVWVAVLAPFVVGERTGRATWLAITGSVVGMALLAHPRPELGDMPARLSGLVSGLCAAGAYLSIRTAGKSNGAVVIVFWFTCIATVISGAGALLLDVPWPTTASGWLCAVGSGVFATAGQLLMTHAYRLAPVAPMAAASASGPLATALLAALVLGQVPDDTGLLGMAVLAVCAVALPLSQARLPETTPAHAAPPPARVL